MGTALTDIGHAQNTPPLFATLTRTLPRLGAGLGLFGGPMEPAGNSQLRYHLEDKKGIDLTV